MSDMVCCPVCWTWSAPGRRATCKKCGSVLIYGNGQPVADLVASAAADVAPDVPAPPPLHPAPDEVPTRTRRFRFLRPIAAAAVAIVVAAGVAGGILAFRFLHGSADSLVSMAPSDSIGYLNINLDPSGGQKLAIDSLLSKFPGLSGGARDATINSWIDTALSGSGLNHGDVRDWLGSEISLVVLPETGSSGSASPAVVGMLASTNDSAAQKVLDTVRSGAVNGGIQWTTTTHGGVTVTSSNGPKPPVVYALTSSTVLIGDGLTAVDEVIDTAQGKHAGIQSMSDYTTVQSQLPTDSVASFYLNIPALVKVLKSSLSVLGAGTAQTLSSLDAYRGVGAAVVVSSSGVSVNATQDYDTSLLNSDQRAMIAIPSHVNGALAFVPSSAFGFLTVSGLADTLRSMIDQTGATATIFQPVLDQLGITGSTGIINHLSGDAGFEVDSRPGSKVPAGAFLFQVDSAATAQSFLSSFAGKLCAMAGGVCDAAGQTSQSYDRVSITTLGLSGGSITGVSPSYAVSGDWAIIASSADEVKAMLDAQHSGGVTASPRFTVVAGQASASNASMFYIDIHSIVNAAHALLPPDGATQFDQNVAPYLSPFQALGVSSQNAGDHTTSTLFLSIS